MEVPLALQLYSVREECAQDLNGTLRAVAEMGYKGVEFAGYYGRNADELKEILDDLQLEVAGTHLSIDAVLGEELERTVEFNKTLGNRFLIVPGLPDRMRNSKAAWLETASLMNNITERIRPEGLRIGYHNHPTAKVFQTLNGELPWDFFFRATSPDVLMQIDCGNAMREGVSADKIIDLVRKYPGRAVTVHLKEFSATDPQALLGQGEMKWREFFETCETNGATEWYIIEQERSSYPPLKAVELCAQNFKRLKGASHI